MYKHLNPQHYQEWLFFQLLFLQRRSLLNPLCLRLIQLLLRHASAKTTENYLSTTNQQILSFKNRLDNVFENDLKQYERKSRKKSKDFEM